MCIKWVDAPRFPKAVEMKIKASREMIFESQLKAGRGVETPGWPAEMEAWRKKHGMTQELNRDMLLEMRLGSRQGQAT